MDKQTLSNYGWLVIVTLILAVMLAFATPFGTYVGDGVVSVANGIVGTSNDATDKNNLSQSEIEWDTKTKFGIEYKNFKYYNNMNEVEIAINEKNLTSGNNKLSNNSILVSTTESNIPVVRLLKDIIITEDVKFTEGIIFDLNGKTITMENIDGIRIVSESDNIVLTSKGNKGVINATNVMNPMFIKTPKNIDVENICINAVVDNIISTDNTRCFTGGQSSADSATKNLNIRDCVFATNSITDTSTLLLSNIENLNMKNVICESIESNFYLDIFLQYIGNGTITNCKFKTTKSTNLDKMNHISNVGIVKNCNISNNIVFNNCDFEINSNKKQYHSMSNIAYYYDDSYKLEMATYTYNTTFNNCNFVANVKDVEIFYQIFGRDVSTYNVNTNNCTFNSNVENIKNFKTINLLKGTYNGQNDIFNYTFKNLNLSNQFLYYIGNNAVAHINNPRVNIISKENCTGNFGEIKAESNAIIETTNSNLKINK